MPKMSKEMNDAFNNQVHLEFESSYNYLSMSYWFAEQELSHLADFFTKQSEEERAHALKLANFIVETGGSVVLRALGEPKIYSSVDEILAATLKHEEHVSFSIHNLYKTFVDEKKEYIAQPLLTWFISEQIEEEDQIRKLIQIRAYVNNDYFFDHRIKRMRDE